MRHVKIIAVAIVAVLLLIVVFQNTGAVETHFLMVTISMPKAVLVFASVIVGFVLGVALAEWLTFKKKRRSGEKPNQEER